MKLWQVIRVLGPVDLRSTLRDPLLGWMIFVPFAPAVIMRFAWPWAADFLNQRYHFDLNLYESVLFGFFLIFVPFLYGVLIGMLLLDERDARTLTALRVTPLTPGYYMVYRLMIPMVLSLICYILILPVLPIQLPGLGMRLLIATPAFIQTSLFALLMGTTVPNKVAGLALYKALSIIFFLPMLLFFWDSPLTWVLAVLPAFWQLKLILLEGTGVFWIVLGVGLIYHGLLLLILQRRFLHLRLD